jgi:hypothetical protein
MQGLIRFLAGLFFVSVVSVAGAAEKISILDMHALIKVEAN